MKLYQVPFFGLYYFRVTILKNKARKSSGVAFILFLNAEDARNCCQQINNTELFGRTLKSSIAKDNGRSTEFIRKKTYPDKSSCYECGEEGHLSYRCPHNILGEREPPPKKERKRKRKFFEEGTAYEDYESDDKLSGTLITQNKLKNWTSEEEEEPDCETLSAAIQMDRQKAEQEGRVGNSDLREKSSTFKRKRIRKNSYFSDEEELSE